MIEIIASTAFRAGRCQSLTQANCHPADRPPVSANRYTVGDCRHQLQNDPLPGGLPQRRQLDRYGNLVLEPGIEKTLRQRVALNPPMTRGQSK